MDIRQTASEFIDIMNQSSSKEDALKWIADHSSDTSFSGIYVSDNFNRLSFHFMNLIDQTVFEVRENYPADPGVRESIFENLLKRIILFCEALTDINTYSTHLHSRDLFFEDTVIINSFSLSGLNSYLTTSFHDYPDLHKPIMKTLLKTAAREETGFFYQIASGSFCYELRISGLLGLKLKSSNNIQWKCIKTENKSFSRAIEYIHSCDPDSLFDHHHNNIFITLFSLYYAELNPGLFSSEKGITKLIGYLHSSLNYEKDDNTCHDILSSIYEIILFLSDEQFGYIIKNDSLTETFIEIIDTLPPDHAVYISRRLNRFRSGITDSVNGLFQSGRLKFNGTASNVIKYISLDM